jgi:hypothetical protein
MFTRRRLLLMTMTLGSRSAPGAGARDDRTSRQPGAVICTEESA